MSPAREPYALPFDSLGLIKRDNLEQEDLFYKYKNGNILPYYIKDICNKVDVFKPCTFLPIFQELDIPFLEGRWLTYIERNIKKGIKLEDLSLCTLGKYISYCKLFDIKDNNFKNSDKFFSDWYDYENFHYIYDSPYWKFSYHKEIK